MKIIIKNADCGLEPGKEYDLCEMSAMTLIGKGHAVEIIPPKAVNKEKPGTTEDSDNSKDKKAAGKKDK